jgi:hypothetical protein
MSTHFTMPDLYAHSLNALNRQPGPARRMAPKKQKEQRAAIRCANAACGNTFTPKAWNHAACSPDCGLALKKQREEKYFAAVRASKNGAFVCASDAKAIEVWNRPRKDGRPTLAEQEKEYYRALDAPFERKAGL